MSLAVTPGGSSPLKWIASSSACAAAASASRARARPRTCRCRTRARRSAPCVDVWLSPQTIVMPGCGQAELRADDVDDALAAAAGRVERDAELLAVAPQRVELRLRRAGPDRAGRPSARCGPSSRGQVRPAHLPPGQAQALERLRRRHLVDEVQVDVEQRRLAPGSSTRCASQTRSKSVFPIHALWRSGAAPAALVQPRESAGKVSATTPAEGAEPPHRTRAPLGALVASRGRCGTVAEWPSASSPFVT